MSLATITPEDLRRYSGNFLNAIEGKPQEHLESHLGPFKSLEYSLQVPGREDRVSICRRPSELGTTCLAISYITPNKGIAMEARINDTFRYSIIIAKTVASIKGYAPLGKNLKDKFGNIPQYTHLDHDSSEFMSMNPLDQVRREILNRFTRIK